jgi:hypothetical protein
VEDLCQPELVLVGESRRGMKRERDEKEKKGGTYLRGYSSRES